MSDSVQIGSSATLAGLAAAMDCELASPRSDRPGTRASRLQDPCVGVVYVWSALMPLSRTGLSEIRSATARLEVPLSVMDASQLYDWLTTTADSTTEDRTAPSVPSSTDSLAARLIGAGATVHFPAVMVYRGRRLVGPAILGYKTSAAYHDMVAERLTGGAASRGSSSKSAGVRWSDVRQEDGDEEGWKDLEVEGRPGPYFRWVPGTRAVAYEASRTVHLLDLDSGRTWGAPGYIDFVPTPDGRFFVTPGPHRSGLEFYHADRVFEAAREGTGADVETLFTDPEMRDQYPSAGIFASDRGATVYRVLTSWFDQVVFRDYEIRAGAQGTPPEVRPLGDAVVGCSDWQVSIPIMSRNGRELAGRDEATGTTKIFRLHDDGRCEEVLDLGLQTGKVAFGPAGRRVAFAIPRGATRDRTGRRFPPAGGGRADELAGIFVLDRDRELITRIRGSVDVNRLAFPDFVSQDSIVFLMSGTDHEKQSRFRLVCCVEAVDEP